MGKIRLDLVSCYFLFTLLLFIMLLPGVFALSFVSNPWMDNTTKSDQDLRCQWNVSADTTQTNISWYNYTVFHSRQTLTPDVKYADLNKSYTLHGEVWSCNVTITNGTDSLINGHQVVIRNADPNNLRLYNLSNNYEFSNTTNLSEDTAYTFYLNATDPDGDGLMYMSSDLPNGSRLTGGVFTWTPDYFNIGQSNITFVVMDNYIAERGTSALDFLFIINEVNDAPYFNPNLTDKAATENTPFTYAISALDEETNYPLSFSIIDSGGLSLVLTNTSNTSANLSFTPSWDDRGSHTIILQVNDTYNKSSNASFLITVSTINHAPSFTYIENSSGTQGGSFTLNLNATDQDSDNLTFSVSANNCSTPNIWSVTTTNNSSNATGLISVATLTNDHVLCRQITLRVTDSKVTTSQDITLNLTNTNDAPIIYEKSNYQTNTDDNINLTNLTAFLLVEFRYRINYTDPDLAIDPNENLTITANVTNTTLFTINNQTGEIIFTPNESMIGTHLVMINLTDNYGEYATQTLTLTIQNNTAPIIDPLNNLTTQEKESFYYDINASDPDGNTYITYSDNTSLFDINPSTGIINFTPTQDMIGIHEITIRATDNFGIYDEKNFTLNITNKNDAPIIGNITFPLLIVTYNFSYTINASDEDLLLPQEYQYDNLTFWTNSSLFTINPLTGLINFTPTINDVGNHSITIIVNDSQGLNDTVIYNFTIHNLTTPPTIINITPHATPTQFNWATISLTYPQKYTQINLSENQTITFNHTTNNTEQDETLTYNWYYDDILIKTTTNPLDKHLTKYFNYSSQGQHNLTLVVDDGRYGYDNFTWRINISDINQPIIFLNQPDNKTISGTTVDNLFLVLNQNADNIFYDPDDPDADNYDQLIFNYSQDSGDPSVLQISITGSTITFTPTKTSNTVVTYIFTASDGYTQAQTDPVTLFINYTKQVETQTRPQTNRQTPQYFQVEVEKIVNQEILFPKTLTSFKNNTVLIPIEIKNNGNKTLEKITLSAKTDNKEVKMTFDQETIERINIARTQTINLIVESYREQGSYEIEVSAKVTNPSFTDTAIVLVDSVQKEKGGDAQTTQTRISYAKDLLSTNPKCLELNELLKEADEYLKNGAYTQAQAKIEETIEACRYLTTQKTPLEEKPDMIRVNFQEIKNNKRLYYSIIGLFSISLFGLVFSIYYTNKKHD